MNKTNKSMYFVTYAITRENTTTLGKYIFINNIDNIDIEIYKANSEEGKFNFCIMGVSKLCEGDYLKLIKIMKVIN